MGALRKLADEHWNTNSLHLSRQRPHLRPRDKLLANALAREILAIARQMGARGSQFMGPLLWRRLAHYLQQFK